MADNKEVYEKDGQLFEKATGFFESDRLIGDIKTDTNVFSSTYGQKYAERSAGTIDSIFGVKDYRVDINEAKPYEISKSTRQESDISDSEGRSGTFGQKSWVTDFSRLIFGQKEGALSKTPTESTSSRSESNISAPQSSFDSDSSPCDSPNQSQSKESVIYATTRTKWVACAIALIVAIITIPTGSLPIILLGLFITLALFCIMCRAQKIENAYRDKL